MAITDLPSNALAEYALLAVEEQDLEKLKEIRKEMKRRGFDKPRRNLTFSIPSELSARDKQDVAKQIKIIRRMWTKRYSSFLRVSYVLYAHQLRGHLVQFGYNDLASYVNLYGRPYDALYEIGYDGVAAYKVIRNLLFTYGEPVEVYKLKIEELGQKYEIVVKTPEEKKSIEGIVKGMEKSLRYKPILKNKYIAALLISAIVRYAHDVSRHFLAPAELEEYNAVLKKYDLLPTVRLDNFEGYEDVKKELVEKGFGFFDEEEIFRTNPKIAALIEAARTNYRRNLMKTAVLMIITPMLKYYLLNSPIQRLSRKPFPSLEENPTSLQLTFLNLASDYYNRVDLRDLVMKKLSLEREGEPRCIGIGLAGKVFGVEFTAKLLNVSGEEVKRCKEYVEERTGKGGKFLKRVGGG